MEQWIRESFPQSKGIAVIWKRPCTLQSKAAIGISCDSLNFGIEAVLFHLSPDGCEQPISKILNILKSAQTNYSQIQKEALFIIFGFKKFYQFIYGRKFILVTYHRPLLVMFGQQKAAPSLAGSQLARWALMRTRWASLTTRLSTEELWIMEMLMCYM